MTPHPPRGAFLRGVLLGATVVAALAATTVLAPWPSAIADASQAPRLLNVCLRAGVRLDRPCSLEEWADVALLGDCAPPPSLPRLLIHALLGPRPTQPPAASPTQARAEPTSEASTTRSTQ